MSDDMRKAAKDTGEKSDRPPDLRKAAQAVAKAEDAYARIRDDDDSKQADVFAASEVYRQAMIALRAALAAEPEAAPSDDGDGKLARLQSEIVRWRSANADPSSEFANTRDEIIRQRVPTLDAVLREIDRLMAEPAEPEPLPRRTIPPSAFAWSPDEAAQATETETFTDPAPPHIAIFIRDRDGHATMARFEQVEWSNATNCWAYTVRHPDNTVPHGVAYMRQESDPVCRGDHSWLFEPDGRGDVCGACGITGKDWKRRTEAACRARGEGGSGVSEPAPSEDEIEALERWGLAWNIGEIGPVLKRMPDGYWTPWHIADAIARRLREKRDAARKANSVHYRDRMAAIAEQKRLEQENDRLRQDRYDALDARTTEGMSAAEWQMRTGTAERQRKEAIARAEKAEKQRDALTWEVRSLEDTVRLRGIEREKAEARVGELGRAIRSLLRARGTCPEGYSTTALKDDAGYFAVDCDRGAIRVHALLAKAEGV